MLHLLPKQQIGDLVGYLPQKCARRDLRLYGAQKILPFGDRSRQFRCRRMEGRIAGAIHSVEKIRI
jgi:hypothetical protein